MKTQIELNQIDIDINYNDYESIVRGFLTLSALNRMKEFDFDQAFKELKHPILNKLREHAQCDYNEFLEFYKDVFYHEKEDFEKFTYQTDYINISINDVEEAIAKMHYEKSVKAFTGLFDNLIELKDRIEGLDENNTKINVILFDEVIHAQHVTGDIFEDLDIDYIKSDLDEELIEIMGINV